VSHDAAPAATDRLRPVPTVTLGLVTYEQEAFVEEAVRAALAQTHEPLEVLICDDASPDGTFDRACEVVRQTPTRHTVRLHRNPRNLGIGTFNQLMSLATGDLIVIAHGDDVSLPERVARIVQAWRASGASLVTSNAHATDARGRALGDALLRGTVPRNGLVEIAGSGWNASLWGAVLAWHREVFDVFGPLDPERSAMTTDWILPFRAAALAGIDYIDEPLVMIRQHPGQKQRRWLNDTTSELAWAEAKAASELIQYLYMLDELNRVVKPRGLQPPEIVQQTIAALSGSILREADRWRRARNGLLAFGFRSRWVPVTDRGS
jgi:glycosyltransferase involved in cell wall biosynthesis